MTIRELVSKLMRPMFVYNMASPMANTPGPRGLGARKRLYTAELEIHNIVMTYAKEESNGSNCGTQVRG